MIFVQDVWKIYIIVTNEYRSLLRKVTTNIKFLTSSIGRIKILWLFSFHCQRFFCLLFVSFRLKNIVSFCDVYLCYKITRFIVLAFVLRWISFRLTEWLGNKSPPRDLRSFLYFLYIACLDARTNDSKRLFLDWD